MSCGRVSDFSAVHAISAWGLRVINFQLPRRISGSVPDLGPRLSRERPSEATGAAMNGIDTMSTQEKLGKIMEDLRKEMSPKNVRPNGSQQQGLVHAIVDRLVTNQVNLSEVSLFDMKRLIHDAALARRGRMSQEDSTSRAAS